VFNQFFPWQINEDGTAEETVNHVGRHELGEATSTPRFNNDPNIQDLYYFGIITTPTHWKIFSRSGKTRARRACFYGISAPEFGTHAAGQLVSLTGGTKPERVGHAHRLSHSALDLVFRPTPPTAFRRITPVFYRNPFMTTDGYLMASHTAWALDESNTGSAAFPGSRYDFRVKFLQLSNGFYGPVRC
jgi:hypothetical protein